MFSPQGLIGLVLAFYLLVGRWTLSRLSGELDAPFWLEPRLWAVGLLAALVLLEQSTRRRGAGPRAAVRLGLVLLLMLAFLGYMAFTSTWAPDDELGAAKAYELSLLGAALVLLYLGLRGPQGERIRLAFWKSLVLLTGAMAVIALTQAASERVAILGGGPNVFGHNMGLLVIGSFFLSRRQGARMLWFWWPLMALGVLLVVLSGSRGALAALVAAGGVYQFIDRQSLSKKLLLLTGACLVGAVFVTQTEFGRRAQETFAYRVLHLTFERQYSSGRDNLFQQAWQMGREYPILGVGANGFAALEGLYPHNLFLEAWSEGGGLGLGLLALALFGGGGGLWRIRRSLNAVALAALAAAFVAAQFSGDLYDNRGVFLMLLMALVPETLPRLTLPPRVRTAWNRALHRLGPVPSAACAQPRLPAPHWRPPVPSRPVR